ELKIWEQDERGSLNAVHEFLRMQGVRWYFPGELGEIVPKKPTIELPAIDKTIRPDFVLRYPYQMFKQFASTTPEEVMWQLQLGPAADPDRQVESQHRRRYLPGSLPVRRQPGPAQALRETAAGLARQDARGPQATAHLGVLPLPCRRQRGAARRLSARHREGPALAARDFAWRPGRGVPRSG